MVMNINCPSPFILSSIKEKQVKKIDRPRIYIIVNKIKL